MNNKKTNQKGFTLIEIMVSVSIFAVIMTTGIGALISLTNSYKQSQKGKQVNDSLNYSLETITREIRLGRGYDAKPSYDGGNTNISPSDGVESSIGFQATDNRGYIVFWLEDGTLKRSTHNSNNGVFQSVDILTNPDEVEITQLRFRVIGTDSLGATGDADQPLVWIHVQARAPGEEGTSTVQTFVSQRLLDI